MMQNIMFRAARSVNIPESLAYETFHSRIIPFFFNAD